jgi:hypothetical protein
MAGITIAGGMALSMLLPLDLLTVHHTPQQSLTVVAPAMVEAVEVVRVLAVVGSVVLVIQ